MAVTVSSALLATGEIPLSEQTSGLEVSVVMPCLNEAETLAGCIVKAQEALRTSGIRGEIIVVDNGSTDGSQAIAERLGARVVRVEVKGYGNALRGGIAQARGAWIVMGDADASYDFHEIPRFLAELRKGYDVVVGNRFKGGIKPGAMPFLHRYFGVPVLSKLARLFFKSPCGDHHCGLRAFSRAAFLAMGLQATGWEFGSEMIARASLLGMRLAEIPTTLSPDGRSRPPHLRSWEAGWTHLRMMLTYCPRWLFFYPGVLLILFGVLTGAWLLPGARTVAGVTFNVHTLLYAATAILLGFQSVTFAVLAKTFGLNAGILPGDQRANRMLRFVSPEAGLIVGALLMLLGLCGSIYVVACWRAANFGPLDFSRGLRIVIPSVLSLALGGQTILSSFFLSVLRVRRKS